MVRLIHPGQVVKLMIQAINLAHKTVHFCMAVHAADAVANIGMLFYHVETVGDVNFTRQCGPAVAIKHSKPSYIGESSRASLTTAVRIGFSGPSCWEGQRDLLITVQFLGHEPGWTQ